MAEESGTTETTGAETGSTGPEIVVDVTASQGVPSIDEKLLMGEDTEEASTEADDTTSIKSEGDDSTDESSTEKETADSGSKEDEETGDTKTEVKADAEAKADTGKDETTDTKSEKTETKKPPKGYVPLPAMQQAREKNRSLEGENSSLKEEIAGLRATVEQIQAGGKQPEQQEEGGFKRLNEQELADLTESSPDEAIKYLAQLGAHQEQQFQQRLEQAQQDAVVKAQREHATAEVGSAYDRIEKAVPGLYDENSEAWNELTSFASEVGITPEVFALASTPEALGLLPGQDEPQLVGTRAADFVEALVGLQEKLASRGSRKETMRNELETEIRAEVEKELLAKFKNDGDSEHRSVTDIQGTKTEVEDGGFGDKVLTHEEFANLSEEERAAYLAGS